jgi:hypothetical protein
MTETAFDFVFETGAAFVADGREGAASRNLISSWMNLVRGSRILLLSEGKPLELPFFRRSLQESGCHWAVRPPGSGWFGLTRGLAGTLRKSGCRVFASAGGKVPSGKKGEDIRYLFFVPYQPGALMQTWTGKRRMVAMARDGDVFIASSATHAGRWASLFPQTESATRVLYPVQDPVWFYRKRPEAIAKLLYEWDLVERPYAVWETDCAAETSALKVLEALSAVRDQIPDDVVLIGPRHAEQLAILNRFPALQGRIRIVGDPGSEQRTNLLDGASFVIQSATGKDWLPAAAEALLRGKAMVCPADALQEELSGTSALFAGSAEDYREAFLTLSLALDVRRDREESAKQRGVRFSASESSTRFRSWMSGV